MNGMRNYFESAVALILSTDPVKNIKKRGHDQIFYVSTPNTAGKVKGREKGKWVKKALFKSRTRKTGVDTRYHKSD